MSVCDGCFVGYGDFNGDGLQDVLSGIDGSGKFQISYVDGSGLQKGPQISLYGACSGGSCAHEKFYPKLADVDSDGRADIISYRDIGSSYPFVSRVYLNRGSEFELLESTTGSGDTFPYFIADIRDANADGFPELALDENRRLDTFGPQRWQVLNVKPDLLQSVKRPLGAVTSITYAYHVPETQVDLPLNLFVVTSTETYDGRNLRAKTDFSYSGAKWDWSTRQFLGFEKIVASLPKLANETSGPVVETTYRQDLASIGKVASIVRKDGSGTVLRKQEETYAVQLQTKPYTSLNTQTVTTTYYGGTARVSRKNRIFNEHGLVSSVIHHGDDSKSGDEWRYTRWSYPNLTDYIVDRWAVEAINSGTSYHYTDNRKWRRWHYYDGATGVTTPPTDGLRTQTSEWTGGDAEDKRVLVETTYDGDGNIISKADGFGNKTSYIYDSTYNLFPIETRTPLYGSDNRHKVLVDWDMVCGVITRQTDENGAETDHSYDALCRKTQTDLPGGGQTKFSYLNWGNANASFNRTRTVHPNGAGEIYSESQFDGLGRVYEERSSGAQGGTGSASNRVHLVFDARGNVRQKSKPYATGETLAWSDFAFDGLDRQILLTHPDGETVTTAYLAGDSFSAVETTDELGHKRVSHFDAFGNEVYRDRFLDTARQRTTYSYDTLNRTTAITDPEGTTFEYTYDGHGNKIAVYDPDLGCQSMAYDDAGRLTEHRYANGSLTTYSYDAAGRIASKNTDPGALAFPKCAGHNDAPEQSVGLETQSVPEDTAWTYTVPANTFVDVNGDTLTYSAALADGSALPTWIAFDGGTRTFTATPPANHNGTTALRVSASDGQASGHATFDLAVTPVNDAPAVASAIVDQSASQDAAWSFTVPAGTFGDVDGDTLSYTAALSDGGGVLPSWLSFNSSSVRFSGTPDASQVGTIGLRVSASDGQETASTDFTLTVNTGNSDPVLANAIPDQAINEDTPWNFTFAASTFSDADGNVLTYSAAQSNDSALPSWLSFSAASRTFSGTPPANYNGTVGLKVSASDGSETATDTFNLTVIPVNDAPVVAVAISDQSIPEDTTWTYSVPAGTFSDVDGDNLSLMAELADGNALPSWLNFSSVTGNFSGTPPANYNGIFNLRVAATDGQETVSDDFKLNVSPVNDPPVAIDDTGFETEWQTAITISASTLLSNDQDIDSNSLSIISVSGAQNGSVSLNGNGSVEFLPNNNFSGTGRFTYTLSDGAFTDSATVTIVVNVQQIIREPATGEAYSNDGGFLLSPTTGYYHVNVEGFKYHGINWNGVSVFLEDGKDKFSAGHSVTSGGWIYHVGDQKHYINDAGVVVQYFNSIWRENLR
nr:putative Ig domain-containing protein [Labrenzia sp. OB1]